MNVKELLKQHTLTILCIAALVALFLPFFSVTEEMEILGQSSSSSATTSGFNAIKEAFLGWGLILGPVLLVATNYVKQLEKYKGLLAIIVPIICIVIELITYFLAKSARLEVIGGNGMVSAETEVSFGIGFFLLIIVYLGMVVVGAVLYHNFTLDKAGLERLKTEGSELFSDGFSRVKQGGEKMIETASKTISTIHSDATSDSSQKTDTLKPTRKSVDRNKSEEILRLIEKLASMKESGILTEEEFSAKKEELLKEI